MMRYISILHFIFILSLALLSAQKSLAEEFPALVDPEPDPQTLKLYNKLVALSNYKGFAFGNQGEYYSGATWNVMREPFTGVVHRSDIHKSLLAGGRNAQGGVSGYNVAWLFDPERNPNPRAFDELELEIKAAHARGELITFHWPMDNPEHIGTSDCVKDCANLIDEVLEHKLYGPNAGSQGKHYKLWKQWMDTFIDFLQQKATTKKGPIPILYRPFHEMNLGEDGKGKWYQISNNNTELYIALWKQTVNYFIEKNVHQLLYVYAPSLNGIACIDCPSGETKADRFMTNYPGDDYVDVIAGDCYYAGINDVERYDNLADGIRIIVDQAKGHGKIPALAETGYKGGMQETPDFWHDQWLHPLKHDVYLRLPQLAYVMTWTNSRRDPGITQEGESSFFVPYTLNDDFNLFYDDPYTLFAEELRAMFPESTE